MNSLEPGQSHACINLIKALEFVPPRILSLGLKSLRVPWEDKCSSVQCSYCMREYIIDFFLNQ